MSDISKTALTNDELEHIADYANNYQYTAAEWLMARELLDARVRENIIRAHMENDLTRIECLEKRLAAAEAVVKTGRKYRWWDSQATFRDFAVAIDAYDKLMKAET